MRNFRDLKVWEKGHKLVLAIYRATMAFPREEIYGLTAQIRRASTSIPSNIAEGCGGDTGGDFARFLQMAMGSASELEYELLLARDLGFLNPSEHQVLAKDTTEVKRMLATLIQRVRGGL